MISNTRSFTEGDSFLDILDKERQAIWQRHPDWSEESRLEAWSQRRAELVSYLLNDASTSPQVRQRLGGSTLSQAQGTGQERAAIDIPGVRNRDFLASPTTAGVPMSRSNTSKSSYLSNMSAPSSNGLLQALGDTGELRHPRTANGYSASYTFGTADWHSTGGINQQQQLDEFVFDPADFVSKLKRSSDTTQSTVERQRVEGFIPSSMPSYPFNVSPSTSMSSDLSPHAFTATSEAMSRQSSMTSNSVVDAVDMMRVGSSYSACSDHVPFSFDEEEELDASFVYCATEQTSSSITTTSYDERNLLGNVGHGAVGLPEHFFIETTPSIVAMTTGQDHDQEMAVSHKHGEGMSRTTSTQSDSSISSADRKASERRQKQIENGKRPIASKTLPAGPMSSDQSKHDSKIRMLKPQAPGTRRTEPIAKQTYIRPHHPKLHCELCDEFPNGFRGEHELRRHHDRAHAQRRKVWVCVDPRKETTEGWRPQRPLEICKQCMHKKQYNVYYNAAAHLRRAHFFPRKRGRRARGEERESRAGKAGGNFPPIDWLKASGFLIEIEVGPGKDDSYMDDYEDEFDDIECVQPESNLELHHANLAADALGFPTYHVDTDFTCGYPTPNMDCAMPWSTNPFPQAPPMEYTLSAPPVLMTMNDPHGLYMHNDLSFTTNARF